MKKFLAMLLTLAMMFALVACGSKKPVEEPTEAPITAPTAEVTQAPTVAPTTEATELPTTEVTEVPTEEPVTEATEVPTEEPTIKATKTPTTKATVAPTTKATAAPTTKATAAPTTKATAAPTTKATVAPTTKATAAPTTKATVAPTTKATAAPTTKATAAPTTKATAAPTTKATAAPTTAATKAPTAAPTAKPTAAPTTKPLATTHTHSWSEATCTAPKTCKTCGITEGEMLPHDYHNGICKGCESKAFGYGKWQSFRVEGNLLYIVTLHGNDEGALTGISNSHYQKIDTVDATKKDEYLQAGAQPITYEGESYLPIGGLGDPSFFQADGEVITVHLGEQGVSMGEYFVLQRKAKNQFAVTQIVGCTAYGLTEGAAFKPQQDNGSKTSWDGNTWYAAVVSQNGEFAMEYKLDTTKKDGNGYPMEYRGGPRYDTIKEAYRTEYPVTFEINGIRYGDNGDYIGVEFVTYQEEGNIVILSGQDNVPSVVLSWIDDNRYKVITHLNASQNTYLHKNLPVGTVFTLVEK